jgi:transketolase
MASTMKATRDAFGHQLSLMGQKYDNIIALDADLGKATKIADFKKVAPDRFFQMGIAEANMIGVASGLSEYGYKVFLGSFGSFLTGRYDIIRCSIAYPNRPVVLVGSHGGLAIGRDGVTQMALEDVSIMRSLPNMRILNPATYSETIRAVSYLCERNLSCPYYLRIGRQPIEDVLENYQEPFELGKAVWAKYGQDITVFSTGCILPDVMKAAVLVEKITGFTVRVINFHTLKPIDKDTIIKCAVETKKLFTVEDHSIIGGLGTIVSEVLTDYKPVRLIRIGLNDVFPESGSPSDLYEKYGLSVEQIVKQIFKVIV